MENVICIDGQSVTYDRLKKITVIEKLLPAGFLAADYDPQENLIEMEDTSDGQRFFMKPVELFEKDLRPGTIYKTLDQNGTRFDSCLETFEGVIRRRRCYVRAVFATVIGNSER